MAQRILMIGLEPDAVDFSDPDLPPGLDADKIREGIQLAEKRCADQGIAMDACLFRPEEDVAAVIGSALAGQNYGCVVIGAGIRLPGSNLALFERVVNAVAAAAPGTPIAFNTTPPDTPDAARRWLPAKT